MTLIPKMPFRRNKNKQSNKSEKFLEFESFPGEVLHGSTSTIDHVVSPSSSLGGDSPFSSFGGGSTSSSFGHSSFGHTAPPPFGHAASMPPAVGHTQQPPPSSSNLAAANLSQSSGVTHTLRHAHSFSQPSTLETKATKKKGMFRWRSSSSLGKPSDTLAHDSFESLATSTLAPSSGDTHDVLSVPHNSTASKENQKTRFFRPHGTARRRGRKDLLDNDTSKALTEVENQLEYPQLPATSKRSTKSELLNDFDTWHQ